jgi:hypothetical protein
MERKPMATTTPSGEKRTDKQREILRELPGHNLNAGDPCICGVEFINTRSKAGYSDSRVYYHACTECGNRFSTWIEG